jgi:mannan endo-1,4-beta-mannosidase
LGLKRTANKKEFDVKTLIVGLVLMCCAGCAVNIQHGLTSANALKAADPLASTRTQAVLDYLVSLPSRSSNRVLSGQHSDYAISIDALYQKTGLYPALLGADYTADISQVNQIIIGHAKAGGLCTVSFHMYNPITGGNAWDTTNVDISQLITPGTQSNNVFRDELDRIYAGFDQLQKNDVVVLFRPFHEMNGGWFWWNAKNSQQYNELWIYTFNYLTKTKGLHNLLWVYSSNSQFDMTYYPGSQYVDIIGFDRYQEQTAWLPQWIGYDEALAFGKPLAITEFGPCNPSANPVCPPLDYSQLIASIKQNLPNIVYWMSWNREYAMDKHLNVQQLLDDPWVITREEITISGVPTGFCHGKSE